jgi:hypothetical protein
VHRLTTWAARRVAVTALTVACVVAGPQPQLIAALERIYAVAVVEDRRRLGRSPDRAPSGTSAPAAPRTGRPSPSRP